MINFLPNWAGRLFFEQNNFRTALGAGGKFMNTPVRNWIKKTLLENVPVGTIWSDTRGDSRFERLTGQSQDALNKRWFGVGTDKKVNYNQSGSDPTFTTCSSFLPRFATSIRRAGGLPTQKFSIYSAKWVDIELRGFQLHKERGWIPAALGYALYGGPKEGDFFQLGHGGTTEHVGIILGIHGDTWSCVAGGAGGRNSRHDGVKRTPYQHKPHHIMGWIDVDVYFRGWNGVNYGNVIDPAKIASNIM
jgi:hypothetical protein